MGRNLNVDSPMCLDILANFANPNHLLNCTSSHCVKSDSIPKEPRFTKNTQCLVQVLHAVSPIWFDVRIHKYKDSNVGWCDWQSGEQFDKFKEDLNEFYKKFFVPVQTISEDDKNSLFVLRKGAQFLRCKILENK